MAAEGSAVVTITRREIAGLPTFLADRPPNTPVRTMAALAFRVGRADEVIVRSGITHLVEHLAMHAAEGLDFQANAFVDDTRTVFYGAGDPQEVGQFLEKIVGALRALPLERLDLERRVLETEAESVPVGVLNSLLAARFGMRTYGLSKYREFGLRSATEDDVRGWCEERFTRRNAVMWIAGELPEELSLDLTEGRKLPPPPVTPMARLETPRYLEEGTGVAGAGFLLPREYASTIALGIAFERLRRAIRVEQAISYAPTASYQWLTGDTAHASLSADALEENVGQVRDEIVRVVGDLASEGPTAEELKRAKALAEKDLEDPANVTGRLDAAATAELMGTPAPTQEQLRSELQAVDAGAVAERMREARASMVLIAPEGLPKPYGGVVTWSERSTRTVQGRRFRGKGLRRSAELFVGDEGITLWPSQEKPLTVRFDEVELVTVKERTLTLYAVDETWIEVQPSALRHGDAVEMAIRAAVPKWKFFSEPADRSAV